jgi:hypothetical protein
VIVDVAVNPQALGSGVLRSIRVAPVRELHARVSPGPFPRQTSVSDLTQPDRSKLSERAALGGRALVGEGFADADTRD